jgi:hypothetical protein
MNWTIPVGICELCKKPDMVERGMCAWCNRYVHFVYASNSGHLSGVFGEGGLLKNEQ